MKNIFETFKYSAFWEVEQVPITLQPLNLAYCTLKFDAKIQFFYNSIKPNIAQLHL